MAARFDGDELALELSVQDLLDSVLLKNLGFSNRGGYERLWLGQAIHSRYQEEALAGDGSYRREVALSLTFDHRGWRVTVKGRADGLRRAEDGTRVVEEIKSIRRGGQLSQAQRELYERQAQLYAWLLTRSEGEEVKPELVLIEIGSEEIERQPVEFDARAVEAGVKRRISALIRSYEGQRQAARERASAGERLPFPYAEMRDGQHEIVDAVDAALHHREHLLLQAPTGIGKTAATLYPALRYCLQHGKRLFILTAKTLQQEMALEVLKLLNVEQAFRSLRLRAKAKMCANDQVLCHEEYCPYAKDYYLKLQSTGIVGRLIDDYPTLEPDDIFERAREEVVCPFEISLELSRQVQVVVCDYNYAFDPYVALTDFADDNDLSDTVLVIDEIHNLVGRGRGYYSPSLEAETARRAGELSVRGGAPIHLRIGSLCAEVARTIEEVTNGLLELEIGSGESDRAVEAPLPEDLFWELRPALDEAFIDYLEHNRETRSFRADDPFVSLYFDYLRFLNGLVLSRDDAFSHCAERRGRRHTVRILCKDPSRFLGAAIARTHSTIGLSATLSPSEFYRDLIGFEPARTSFEAIPSPFPTENRRVVIDATVATAYRERPANYGPIAERLAQFAAAVPGNCLALFPSYTFLAEVAARMPEAGKRVLIQEQSSGDRERQEILHSLRSAMFGDVLLLAVAGGVFAEGVDYPGETLKAVAIVGPCLPGLSLEQRLLKDYYQERFDRGFEYAFVVPGMTRVVQAAGRLIRSPEDTGVIALLDRRFLHRPYREHLPGDWVEDGNPTPLKGEPARAALEFFAALDGSESVN
ncbi:MAG: helicase C-terminal domain-containing protein [Acidobacteriota bacterium]